MTGKAISLLDQGQRLSFTFADMLSYHGPGSPGGVAHAFKVLERALPLLSPEGTPPERRELTIRTAFGGPGARDAFELTCRAVTGGRYFVDASLERPLRGLALERFVFCLSYRTRAVTLTARDGFVTEQFILLARKTQRTAGEEESLKRMKREMADRVMSAPAPEVYDAAEL